MRPSLWTAAHTSVSRDTMFNDTSGWTTRTVTRLATEWDKRVETQYLKDANGRLDSVHVVLPGSIAATGRRYAWNATTGTLTAVRVNGADVTLGYDTELMPIGVTQPGGLTRNLSPTSIHELFKAGYSTNGADTLLWRGMALDTLGRVVRQYAYANSSIDKTQYTYRYDARGRLIAVHDSTLFAASSCDGVDFGVRLCSAYTALLQWKDSLSYDRVGNAVYADGFTGAGTATYDKNRITNWPGYTYTWDAAGNLTQRAKSGGATTNFYWSADGLLDSVIVGARKIRYDYNGFGQLVRKRVDGASAETRHFFWTQGHLLAELDATLSNRVGEYAYFPGTDQPMALLTGATTVTATRYFQQDAQGSVIGLTKSDGTVEGAVIVSRPWGEQEFWAPLPPADTVRLRWQGLFYEGDATQLYYVRARCYDPITHRFLTQDPTGLEGGINPYTFAANDPINYADPTGKRLGERGPCTLMAASCGDAWWTSFEPAGSGGAVVFECKEVRPNVIQCKRNDHPVIAVGVTGGAVVFGGPTAASGIFFGGSDWYGTYTTWGPAAISNSGFGWEVKLISSQAAFQDSSWDVCGSVKAANGCISFNSDGWGVSAGQGKGPLKYGLSFGHTNTVTTSFFEETFGKMWREWMNFRDCRLINLPSC